MSNLWAVKEIHLSKLNPTHHVFFCFCFLFLPVRAFACSKTASKIVVKRIINVQLNESYSFSEEEEKVCVCVRKAWLAWMRRVCASGWPLADEWVVGLFKGEALLSERPEGLEHLPPPAQNQSHQQHAEKHWETHTNAHRVAFPSLQKTLR